MATATVTLSSYEKVIKDYGTPQGDFAIMVTIENPEAWDKMIHMGETFMRYWEDYFKEIVFECHRYLIRLTPIRTGRLRSGWTSILNKYNQDYTAAFYDTSLVEVKELNIDPEAISEGTAMAQYVDEPFHKSLINAVTYGEYVEYGTSSMEGRFFTQRAMYKGEFIFTDAINDWLQLIQQAGEVVKPPKVKDTTI